MKDDLKCPYCEADNEICHDDGQGFEEDRQHEMQCRSCKKYFVFTTSIHFYYEPYKADCLNDKDHKFKRSHTHPTSATVMRCTDCEEERVPTSDEWLEIIGDWPENNKV